MIEVEKRLKITIDGEDAERLIDVCELARRMAGRSSILIEYGEKRLYEIKAFLNTIFDNA